MKLRFQTIFVLFLTLGVISTSCDDDESFSATNSFTIDDVEYDLSQGILFINGPNGEGGFDFDVALTSSTIEFDPSVGYFSGTGDIVVLDLDSPSENTLEVGTYNFAQDRSEYTMTYAAIGLGIDADYGSGDEIEATAGSVEVRKSGSETVLTFNLTLSDGRTVAGSYKSDLIEYEY